MFALIDCNAFYASAERVFQPALRRRPLVVLSNGDGCAIARSDEAKSLGVAMGQPAHELRDLVRDYGLVLQSANFALYGDMSRRVVEVLRTASPRIQVYSIDESFVSLSSVRNPVDLAYQVRDRVLRWTGIPNCVGLGPTKTLAKAANKLAKRGAGVVDLTPADVRAEQLASLHVADVWGVGPRWAAKLASLGITTAAQLRDAPADLLLQRFGVVLARTQRELQGLPCLELEEVEPDRQQIMVSRSFGQRVEDLQAVTQAICTFAVRASEKMRSRGLATSAVWVFANTDTFRPELPQHHPSRAIPLPWATQDSRLVLAAVKAALRGFLQRGCAYKRAGVALMDLTRPEDLQGDLFGAPTQGNEALMSTLDRINQRFGRGTVGFAATGWKPAPAWGTRQLNVSPHFTTRWSDLPTALC